MNDNSSEIPTNHYSKHERSRFGYLNMKERSMEDYFDLLGISAEDLGKKVLDVGSGKTELFARELAQKGIDVISVNPLKAKKKIRTISKISQASEHPELPFTDMVVAADVLSLPFADSTFDSVVALWSVPYYLKLQDKNYRENVDKMASEILRVVRQNGHIFFHPLYGKRLETLESVLAEKDVIFSRFQIPEDIRAKHYKFPSTIPYYSLRVGKISA